MVVGPGCRRGGLGTGFGQERIGVGKNGFGNAVLQVASERDPRFPDVPTALELLPANDANRPLVETMTNILVADRVLVAPPNLGQTETEALRKAVDDLGKDAEFLQKAEQAGFPIKYLTGEDLQASVVQALDAGSALKTIFEQAAAKAQ